MLSKSLLRQPLQQPFQQLSRFANPIRTHQRSFHITSAAMVQVGDTIPSIELREDSPGNKVDLAKELASGKGVIIGVPAAFSPSCSDTHIPGYLTSPNLKSYSGKLFVVSVNDAFVMKAWGKSLDADKSSGIRFIADPAGDFTRALDLEFDATAFFGNKRGKRYALQTEDGKITKVSVEEDPSQITVSGAEKNL